MALIAIGFLFAVIYPLALAVAGEPAKQMAASADSQVQIPQGLSSQEIDAYLAGLSEEQVRQVLSQKLKNNLPQDRAPAAEDYPDDSWMPIESTFNRMEEAASAALDRIVSVFKSVFARCRQCLRPESHAAEGQ